MKLGTHTPNNPQSCQVERHVSFLQIIFCCLLYIVVIPAFAQDREAAADSQSQANNAIEEVLVTARKREEQLQDVPISVSAFTSEDIAARSATSLSEIANFTPNFTFVSHSVGTSVFIRGVGQGDGSVFFDPGVGIYIDGVYIARMRGVDFDLLDLERVEVLRGPQGTLFGKNTIGGALNIITKRPGQEFSGSAEFTTGRYTRMDGTASIDVPLAPGTLAARFSAATRNRDGYAEVLDFNTGAKIGELGAQDTNGGRAVFDWTPSEDVDVLITVDGSKSREPNLAHTTTVMNVTGPIALVNLFVEPDIGPQMVTGNPYSTYGSGSNYSDTDTWGIAVNALWDRGGWSFRSITSYRDLNFAYGIDGDNGPYDILDQRFTEFSETFTQEFQLAGLAMEQRLNWIAGVYYLDETSGMTADTLLLQPLWYALGVDSSLNLAVDSDASSWAVFGQGTYDLTDKLSMTLGLRYNEDKKDVTRGRHSVNRPDVITLPFESLGDTWDATTGRADIQYRWTDDVMTYFSIARGYKSGGVNGAGLAGATTAFDPEFIWTYEFGLRSEFLEHRVRFNASAYKSNYSDLQFRIATATPQGQPIAIVDNAAKAKINGFEVEITAVPAPGLEFNGSVGYTDAEYSSLDPGTPVTLADKFALIPEWTYTLAAQYTLPLGQLGGLTGRLDYSHKGGVQLAAHNTPSLYQDSYAYLNGRLTFRSNGDKWEVAAFVTNITDEVVAIVGTDFASSFGFVDITYAPPRQWGLSFKYNF